MLVVNIHDAKTNLSRLVEQASKGEAFIIARAGKPLVKVMALDAPDPARQKRLGFLEGQMTVPDDFDRMGETEIQQLFGGGSLTFCWIRICCSGRSDGPTDCRPKRGT